MLDWAGNSVMRIVVIEPRVARFIAKGCASSARSAGALSLMLLAVVAVFGQSPTRSFEVSGVVLDPNGAVIADARVILRREVSRWAETKTTNQRGEFRFTRIATGEYEIEARRDDFKPNITRLMVGAKSPSPLTIVLAVAGVREEISVGDRTNQVNTSPDENLNVIKLDQQALKNLPILGNDVLGSVANLLDAGSLGSNGPTIIIDGLESSKSASTIHALLDSVVKFAVAAVFVFPLVAFASGACCLTLSRDTEPSTTPSTLVLNVAEMELLPVGGLSKYQSSTP